MNRSKFITKIVIVNIILCILLCTKTHPNIFIKYGGKNCTYTFRQKPVPQDDTHWKYAAICVGSLDAAILWQLCRKKKRYDFLWKFPAAGITFCVSDYIYNNYIF